MGKGTTRHRVPDMNGNQAEGDVDVNHASSQKTQLSEARKQHNKKKKKNQ